MKRIYRWCENKLRVIGKLVIRIKKAIKKLWTKLDGRRK